METVRVQLAERSYDIVIGKGLLEGAGQRIRQVVPGRQTLLLYDQGVANPWADTLAESLRGAGLDVTEQAVPSGEKTKCSDQLIAIWHVLASQGFTRDCSLVALGGGVAGDLGGFAAASFLRGIAYVQVPTTILAMVDSSVGGKTGINLPQGKNLVGAFWQPRLVIEDLDVLETLDKSERNSGMAEIIKHGIIRDADYFRFLEDHLDGLFSPDGFENLVHTVKRSVEIKAEVVGTDERESGLRRILNFGHTIGHAIEAEASYSALRHGECVGIGMAAASLLTLKRNETWTARDHQRVVRLIERAGLPTRVPGELDAESILARTRIDKKAVSGGVRYVLPTRIGHVQTVADVRDDQVLAVLRELRAD
jgi:3-dehydroquinate synthase